MYLTLPKASQQLVPASVRYVLRTLPAHALHFCNGLLSHTYVSLCPRSCEKVSKFYDLDWLCDLYLTQGECIYLQHFGVSVQGCLWRYASSCATLLVGFGLWKRRFPVEVLCVRCEVLQVRCSFRTKRDFQVEKLLVASVSLCERRGHLLHPCHSIPGFICRNLLREEVNSGRLDAAPSKAAVLDDLCTRLHFDVETAGALHRQLYRQKLDSLLEKKSLTGTIMQRCCCFTWHYSLAQSSSSSLNCLVTGSDQDGVNCRTEKVLHPVCPTSCH